MFRSITTSVSLALFCLISTVTNVQAANRDEVIFFFNDALGSAVAAVSESGELCWSEEYTAYGDKGINDDVFNTTGCGIVGEERGFTGHTEDVNSDLVYMQQRYYDPSIGRFLSIDPVGSNPNNPMTFNRYAYANNNPYRYTDPTGEIPFDTVFDAVSVVYDIGKIGVGYATGNSTMISDGVIDLTGDIGALLTPYVPAGSTKVARALAKAQNKVTKGAKQTLEERAADLVKRNDGKNRVSISHPNGRTNIDLDGKSHNVKGIDVPTPHVQDFKNNVIPNGPRAGQVGSRSPDGPTRSATANDLRLVDRFLQSQGK